MLSLEVKLQQKLDEANKEIVRLKALVTDLQHELVNIEKDRARDIAAWYRSYVFADRQARLEPLTEFSKADLQGVSVRRATGIILANDDPRHIRAQILGRGK